MAGGASGLPGGVMLVSRRHDTPVGPLTLVASDRAIVAALWPNDLRVDGEDRVRLAAPFSRGPSEILHVGRGRNLGLAGGPTGGLRSSTFPVQSHRGH